MVPRDPGKPVPEAELPKGKPRRHRSSVADKEQPASSISLSSTLQSRQSLDLIPDAPARTPHPDSERGAQASPPTAESSGTTVALVAAEKISVSSSKPNDAPVEADPGVVSQSEKPAEQQFQMIPTLKHRLSQPETLTAKLFHRKLSTGPSSAGSDAALAAQTRDNTKLYSVTALLLLVAAIVVGGLFAVIFLFTKWESQVLLQVPGLGRFRGFVVVIENQPLYVFRGVRFGQDTAGDKRFDRPTAWTNNRQHAVTDARLSKPGCVQQPLREKDKYIEFNNDMTEDCLHLNVWTPCTEASEPGCRRTVVVFLSSRGFQQGNNNHYDGRWFAAIGQVVVVVPNFRQGAFGFLDLGVPGAPGNVALDDQRLALEWVVSHIGSFGGNASDVVLMGSAAGAWSVGAHITGDDPFWRHERFAKVILHSESPLRRYYANTARRVTQLLGCPVEDRLSQLSCLRNASAHDVVRVTSVWDRRQGPSTTRAPESAARVVGRRFLVGVVSDEGSQLADLLRRLPSRAHDLHWMASEFLTTVFRIKLSAELADAYRSSVTTEGGDASGEGAAVSQLLGDVLYVCPLIRLALELAAEHRNLVWGFLFDHRASFARPYDGTGAPRFSELDFLFGRVLDGSVGPASSDEQRLARELIEVWTGFAKRGSLPRVNQRTWPSYADGRVVHVRITQQGLEEMWDFKKNNCSIVTSYVPYAARDTAARRKKDTTA
ncbi:acetylcholinesterase-like [Dermacentor albipictus]|uniref:acetylcholinesterase-like n=1 Tax=Dermacentor albipictus TaxID=60249 RepID=UPI0038FC5A4E